MSKLKEDTAYLLRMLSKHEVIEKPKRRRTKTKFLYPTAEVLGRPFPLIELEEEDSRFVAEKLRSLGKMIVELQHLLLPKGELITYDEFRGYQGSFHEPVEKLKESFKKSYNQINFLVQRRLLDHGELYSDLSDFQDDLFSLELRILEVESLTLDAPTVEASYVQREIEINLAKMEDEKTRVRQKIFLRADSEGKKLFHTILYAESEKERNESVGRLMYLAGFDYEIYFHLKGNIDVLVYHTGERIGILIESTTSKPLKDKVDQVIARRKEYEKYFEEIHGKNPRIHSLLITTNEQPKLHDEARADAMQNEVSIFTQKQIEELVDLLKKGKLNRRKVIDTIRKNIPT